MRDRPILFSGPMVRAILEGRKTQTRRVVRPQPSEEWSPIVEHYCPTKIASNGEEYPGEVVFGAADENEGRPCPFGAPGDRLWVRETWGLPPTYNPERHGDLRSVPTIGPVCYGESYGGRPAWPGGRWRPSIHMPRWASRLTLEVTGVRVERVQEITEEDARAEGAEFHDGMGVGHSGWRHDRNHGYVYPTASGSFGVLWNSINAKRGYGWYANPWVWVIEFRRITA